MPWSVAVLLTLLFAAGGSGPGGQPAQEARPWLVPPLELPAEPRPDRPSTDTLPPLFDVALREAAVPRVAAPRPARVTALDPDRARALLARLPGARAEAGAGGAGEEGPAEGPGGTAREGRPGGGLRIDAVLPRGETRLAPHLTVVFSRPMVALGADGEPAGSAPPVSLSPEPPGRWRWLDPRTLRFEPDAGRLPGGTTYRIRVPETAASVAGSRLDGAFAATLTTLGPLAVGGHPNALAGSRGALASPGGPLLLVFDQEMAPDAVLRAVRLRVADAPVPVGLAGLPELEAEDPALARAAAEAGEGRWVALRPEAPMPGGAEAVLSLGAELRSSEGSVPTGRPQELRFRVRPAFQVASNACGDASSPCPADGFWRVRFSTPLDPEQLLAERVRVEPEVRDLRVYAFRDRLALAGDLRPHTRYRLHLDPELRDRFGQTLAGEATLEGHVGAPPRMVVIPGAPFLTLDPAAEGRVDVLVRAVPELRVELYRVAPGDWPSFRRNLDAGRDPRGERWSPGDTVATWTVRPADGGRGYTEVPVDVSRALPAGSGHALLVVRGGDGDRELDGQPFGAPGVPGPFQAAAWIQATSFAVGGVWDPERLVAWAVSLDDRRPLEGVRVRFARADDGAVTDAAGLASLPLEEEGDSLLLARLGDEEAILPARATGRRTWAGDPAAPAPIWHTVTDRGVYRPGEEVVVHGWLRELVGRPRRDLAFPTRVDTVRYRVLDVGREAVAEGVLPVTPRGTFHLAATLPPGAGAGHARVEFTASPEGREEPLWRHRQEFRIEAFRTPTYEVRAEVDPGPHVAGEPLRAVASAAYYAGTGLPGAPVTWRVIAEPARWWTPPDWDAWHFGAATSWRWDGSPYGWDTESLDGRTDGGGRHAVEVSGAPNAPHPVSLALTAEVRDVDRRAGSATTTTVLHPAAVAAALRPDRHWLLAGDALVLDVAVTDLEGRPRAGLRPTVLAEMEPDETRPGGGGARAVPVACERAEPEPVGSRTIRPLRCTVNPPGPGVLSVRAEVVDDRGRTSRTDVRAPVFGSSGNPRWWRRMEGVGLHPDRPTYRPGDTVRLALSVPTYPATGLLTVLRHGIQEVRPIRVEGPGHVESIPVGPEDAGGFALRVVLDPANGASRALAGWGWVPVELEHRRLAVEVRPDAPAVAPGGRVTLDLAVEDPGGTPASGGRATVWVVDEAVLALTGYPAPDPLAAFHRSWTPSHVTLPQATVRWRRRSLGPGVVSAEVIDGATGAAARGVVATLEGAGRESRGWTGALAVEDVAPGRYRLVLSRDGVTVLERDVVVPADGVDLGRLVLRPSVGSDQAVELEAVALGAPYERVLGMSVAATDFSIEGGIRSRRGGPETTPGPVGLRTDFRALAAFEADVALDRDGRGRVDVRLPDGLTRYRIYAVATHGPTRFGVGTATVTAARDLVVRATPPRLLRPGDRAEIPVVVENASDADRDFEVAARSRGLALDIAGGYRVALPAGGRAELRFPARAGPVGEASFEVIAAATGGADDADAVGVPVPVRPALAPRAAALHATLEPGGDFRLPLEVPARAVPGVGGVDVGLSTSRLQPLVEALRALCVDPLLLPEPTVARALGLAALAGTLETLRAPDLPGPDALRALARTDVERLEAWLRPLAYGIPSPVGGSPFLRPFDRVHAVHAVHEARRAGLGATLRPNLLSEIARRAWTAELERLDAAPAPLPGWRYAPAAYALHVLAGVDPGGLARSGAASRWLAGLEPGDLPVEALAWLLRPASLIREGDSLRSGLLRELENRAVVTAATATFRQGEIGGETDGEDGLRRLALASDRRSDAVALAALVEQAPGHFLVDGLVRGLLGHRDGTRAGGAHENGWVLFALGRYAAAEGASRGPATARVLLGGQPLLEGADLGPGVPTVMASAPLPPPGTTTPLEVSAAGDGTIHVRAGVRYAPVVTPDTPAEERGFLVSRRYEAVDDPADVRLEPEGGWRIRAGARVRVRVTFTAPSRRYQVRLSDPLPAGLEAVAPGLRGTGFIDDPEPRVAPDAPRGRVSAPLAATLSNYPFGWEWTDLLFRWRARWAGWAAHEEVRDDRVEAYAPYLPAGTWQTTYLVRATLPGAFLAPPPRVEETENPETYGQGRPDRVVIEVR